MNEIINAIHGFIKIKNDEKNPNEYNVNNKN